MNAKKMYTPFQIGGLSIKNRLVASAMFEYGAEDGKITERIKNRYRQLAEGGFGLIITGMHAISREGRVAPIMVETTYNDYENDLRSIVDTAHVNGSKIVVQLQHAGYGTFPQDGYDHFGVCDKEMGKGVFYHAMTREEMADVAQGFAAAAARCRVAGADGVQIHAAHGFLLNTFLSPSTNHRTDEYGGGIANRARLLFEIYEAIRTAVGKEFIVSVKFPFSDLIEQSITEDESLFVCQELAQKGADMIEVSSGMVMDGSAHSFTPFMKKGTREGIFRESAAKLAEKVSVPVISVCGYRSPSFIEGTLEHTKIAAVSFGRPTVREPNLPKRWQEDDSPAACISCNRCCTSFNDGVITCQVLKDKMKKSV